MSVHNQQFHKRNKPSDYLAWVGVMGFLVLGFLFVVSAPGSLYGLYIQFR